jgi:hypothetical protein
MSEIRGLLHRAGAGLAAGAAAVLSGLGYTQVHQLFPLPPLTGWWFWGLALLALASALAAVLGAGAVAWIALQAQRRILMSSDPNGCDVKGTQEQKLVKQVFDATAAGERARTLRDLDRRCGRLERAALRRPKDDPVRALMSEEALRLREIVELAIRQAALRVLERRASRAFRSRSMIIAAVAAGLGIIGLYASADYSKGKRDQVDLAAKCAKEDLAVRPDWCKTLAP